jgi:hypothetical protein
MVSERGRLVTVEGDATSSGTTGSAVRAAEEGRRLVEVLVVFVGAEGGIASASCILGKF